MRKYIVWLLLCALAAASIWGCGQAVGARYKQAAVVTPEYVFTYAENQAMDYPTTQGAYKFSELVKEETKGRILINVYAEGELGDEKSVCEQLQFGGIDFMRISLSPLSDTIPKLNVLQLPYLYRGTDHMWQVLEGDIGRDFMDSFEGSDLVPLSWYVAGARNFYNSQGPITRLEDMKGLNIRVQESGMMTSMVKALGAHAIPMPFADVYSALQIGTIDGAENNWPSYESTYHYEVAKFFTIDEHNRVPEVQMISEKTWDKLSPEDQVVIRRCAEESAKYERALWAEREKASEEKVRAGGCQVVELSAQEKERFQAAVLPVYEEYCSEYMDIVEAIIVTGR